MSEEQKNYRPETIAVHGGLEADPVTGARAVPIYQSNAFKFNTTEHAANLFGLKENGYIYTRIHNPTTTVFEERVAQLEGGVGALAVASGSAAITYAVMNIAGTGDEIVSASTLYGGTYNLFSITLPKYGIKTVFVNPDDPENFRKAINEKTKALKVDLDNVKVEKKAGGSIHDTSLIRGIILDKEVVHSGMPKRIEKAKIALINSPLEIEKTEMSAEIRISDPQQMQMFLEEEHKY